MGRVPVADLTRAAPWPWMHHLSTAAALLNRRASVAVPGNHQGCPGDLKGRPPLTHVGRRVLTRKRWKAWGQSKRFNDWTFNGANRSRSPGVQGWKNTRATVISDARVHCTVPSAAAAKRRRPRRESGSRSNALVQRSVSAPNRCKAHVGTVLSGLLREMGSENIRALVASSD